MKLLVISNIPSPYRIDFFNELGKNIELTVLFEAKTANGIKFNWNIEKIKYFKAIFLKEGDIQENRINWSILKYINSDQFDEIIVTSYAYLTEMVALLALKFKRIPYFLEVDGGLIRKEHYFKKLYKSFLISGAKGYFSPSKLTDNYLIHYGAQGKKIHRYPFTSLINKDILDEIIEQEEKLKIRERLKMREPKIILSVGQFIHRKGFDVLLNACKTIGKDVGVYIIGGEPTAEYLEFKSKFGLVNVHFDGFKTKQQLSEYFKAADIFVLPTREDVWGLVINEAMSYGLPVVTTDKCISGIELIDNNENGFVVPVENETLIADKVKFILANDNLSESMGLNNLKKIKRYTIENMAKIHLEVLERYVNKDDF